MHAAASGVPPSRAYGRALTYRSCVAFRDRLLATVEAMAPVLAIEGVLVAGSEVPNLAQHDLASTLVVSEDLDLAIPIDRHAEVKAALGRVQHFRPSPHEPSVWLPLDETLIEVNFIGVDRANRDPTSLSVLEDSELPLMVFGALSLLVPGRVVEIGEARARLPRPAGLVLEKLLTERSGLKGERDLLVALAMLAVSEPEDLDEVVRRERSLPASLRAEIRRNLTVLALAGPTPGMPDPRTMRDRVAALASRLETGE